MIILNKFFVKLTTRILKFFTAQLGKDVKRKYNVEPAEQKKEEPKLMKDWYRCGKCHKLIDVREMVFEYDKTYGRKTKCPHCKQKIVHFKNAGNLEYDPKTKKLVKKKPAETTEECTIKLPKKG